MSIPYKGELIKNAGNFRFKEVCVYVDMVVKEVIGD